MSNQTASITVYRTTTCPFCVAAAQALDDLGAVYEEVSPDNHPDRRSVTNEILPGHMTVPLIVVDGSPIGGYQELMGLQSQGKLQPMLFGD